MAQKFKQTTGDVALRFFQDQLHKNLTVARKKASSTEHVSNNSCCGRFQVSMPNQSSNLIVCNNHDWVVFHPYFHLLCVVCLQRLHEGNVQKLQFMSAVRWKANNVHPLFPSTASHLDIPRIVPTSVRIKEYFLDVFTERAKYLKLCIKLSFWTHPAL
jgi:hypothetical protein